jgi:surfactin synthase thioesterase subunit
MNADGAINAFAETAEVSSDFIKLLGLYSAIAGVIHMALARKINVEMQNSEEDKLFRLMTDTAGKMTKYIKDAELKDLYEKYVEQRNEVVHSFAMPPKIKIAIPHSSFLYMPQDKEQAKKSLVFIDKNKLESYIEHSLTVLSKLTTKEAK